eukprot:SAG22_NODE_9115_length_609_cov_1.374510_2_plen_109_part_00
MMTTENPTRIRGGVSAGSTTEFVMAGTMQKPPRKHSHQLGKTRGTHFPRTPSQTTSSPPKSAGGAGAGGGRSLGLSLPCCTSPSRSPAASPRWYLSCGGSKPRSLCDT